MMGSCKYEGKKENHVSKAPGAKPAHPACSQSLSQTHPTQLTQDSDALGPRGHRPVGHLKEDYAQAKQVDLLQTRT